MAVGILVTALQLNAAEQTLLPSETSVEQQPTHHRSPTEVIRTSFADETEGRLALQKEVTNCVESGDVASLKALNIKHYDSPSLREIVRTGIIEIGILKAAQTDLAEIERQEISQIRTVINSKERGIDRKRMIDQASAKIKRNLKRLEQFRSRSLPRGVALFEQAEALQKELEDLKAKSGIQILTMRPADEIDELLMPSPRPLKPSTDAELKELGEVREFFKKCKENYIPGLKRGTFGAGIYNRYIKMIEDRKLIAIQYQQYEQGQELIKEADELIQELTKIKAELKNNTHVSRPYLVGGIVATVAVVAAVIWYFLYKKPAAI